MRTMLIVLVLVLGAGCGSSRNVTLDGSTQLDQLHGDPDRTVWDGELPDQTQPDQTAPDLHTAPDLPVPPKDVGTCSPPNHSSDCSQVSGFQCGFSASCTDGKTIKADWHEHVMCPDMEQIYNFTCSYTCPNGCNSSTGVWPQNGADLVKQLCKP